MKYLSVERVLFIHSRVLRETGGTAGVQDLSLLLPAVHRPQAIFEGKDLYPGLLDKAAALLESLACNHALVDGNKRTAIVSTGIFLQLNGRRLHAEPALLEAFVLRVAQGKYSFAEIVAWLDTNSEEI